MKPKTLILHTDGINCNVELARAFELAGAETESVHLNEFLEGKRNLSEFDIIGFSGGFSYGDDIKSGKIFSINLLKLKDDIQKFIDDKKLIIGVCNGFQVLTTLGIIPFDTLGEPKLSLYWNKSAKFECRWVDLEIDKENTSPWLKGLAGQKIKIQAAHAEGRLMWKSEEDFESFKSQVAFRYLDENGNVTEKYPFNPNGTKYGIAGLTDKTGQVLGMMPHPERNAETYQHPFEKRDKEATPDGLQIFINAVNYFKN